MIFDLRLFCDPWYIFAYDIFLTMVYFNLWYIFTYSIFLSMVYFYLWYICIYYFYLKFILPMAYLYLLLELVCAFNWK